MNNDIVQIEKKSSNKIGIIVVIIIFLAIIGGVGFFLYKNKDNLEFHLPWQKEKEKVTPQNSEVEVTPIAEENKKLVLPNYNAGRLFPNRSNDKGTYDYIIKLDKINLTDTGYEIIINGIVYKNDLKLKVDCEKITIDDYEVNDKFTMNADYQNSSKVTVKISLSELNELAINDFTDIKLYCTIKYSDTEVIDREVLNTTKPLIIETDRLFRLDNNKENLERIDLVNNVEISYYKTIADDNDTYIYFQCFNGSEITQYFQIKSLFINDEIYDYDVEEVATYKQSKKIFHIKIPKNKIKKVNKFAISFLLIDKTNKDSIKVYITQEGKITIKDK